MVYHITNYMRETNVWMIRKMRWMLWGFWLATPIYRNVYWDFHARRVAWKGFFDFRSEKQKAEDAKAKKGNWGYKPRYEPIYDFSIKTKKHATMTKREKINDTPRIYTSCSPSRRKGLKDPMEVKTMTYVLREHNRTPGAFDYTYPQEFYSFMPEIDFDAYVVLGSKQRRGVVNLELSDQ